MLAIVDRGRVVAEGSPENLKSELRGDTVQVEVAGAIDGNLGAAVAELPGLRELAVDGRVVRARADDGAAAIPSLISALERTGLRVASATIARPSLDDVYLRHAGRSLEQADTEQEVAA
jgi:ABC-2 type transport system ATP-binding protein